MCNDRKHYCRLLQITTQCIKYSKLHQGFMQPKPEVSTGCQKTVFAGLEICCKFYVTIYYIEKL